MTNSGFAEKEVPASGAFHFFFVKNITLNDNGAFCTAVVRAVPSRVNTDEFQFETTLIMDAVTVSDTLQPAIFWGKPQEFVEKEVSLFNTLFTMERHYHRDPRLIEEQEDE